MSEFNHPNFHALHFATQIISTFYVSLRGKANKKNAPNIKDDIIEFVSKIEGKVDAAVEDEAKN